jgi:hypothetical protein
VEEKNNMTKQKPPIAETLASYLYQLPPDKQAELFAHWTVRHLIEKQNQRTLLWASILSGSIGIVGVLAGVILSKFLQ